MSRQLLLSRRRLCVTAASLPLAGCVVAPYGPYYRPATAQPGAQERRAWCQGAAGPVTGVDMDLGGGVRLRASTDRLQVAGWPLRIEITLPRQTALRFTEPVRLVSGGKTLETPLAAVALRTVAVDPTAWSEPQSLRPGLPGTGDAPHGELKVRTQPLAIPAPARMVVEGLALVRDGNATMLPAATLERVNSRAQPYAYRSAQEEAALQARVAACRRDTPRLACQNIIDFAGASHSAGAPGVRWSWRWWVAPHAGAPTVDGELTLAVLEPGRWRLDASRLQLVEGDSRASHPVRLAPGVLSFSDRLDLQQGVAAGSADTRVLLEAVLPQGLPDFEVRLPPLLRNGERMVIAPLHFERRSFDGGVEPFNC